VHVSLHSNSVDALPSEHGKQAVQISTTTIVEQCVFQQTSGNIVVILLQASLGHVLQKTRMSWRARQMTDLAQMRRTQIPAQEQALTLTQTMWSSQCHQAMATIVTAH